MPAVNTAKGRLLKVTVKGVDLTPHVRHIACRESVCSSYLTSEIMIYDTINLVDSLNLAGEEPVTVSFDAILKGGGGKDSYEALYQLLAIQEIGGGPDSARTKVYQFSCVGPEFFTDRHTVVTESMLHVTGCAVARRVWADSKFTSALRIPVEDTMITQGDEPYQINLQKPFTALQEVRDQMHFPGFKTGNVLLYRDYDSEVLVPLQYIFDNKQAQANFIERETAGTKWRDIFESEHDIIHVAQQTRNQSGAGGGKINSVGTSSTGSQAKKAWDAFQGKFGSNLMALGGGLGGSPNFQMNNSNRVPSASDFTQKTEMERAYAASMKAGPQFNVRVPLQLGINMTVGKGVFCKLLPVVGDLSVSYGQAGGLMLVTDLVHEVWQEIKPITGMTTFQCMKGTDK